MDGFGIRVAAEQVCCDIDRLYQGSQFIFVTGIHHPLGIHGKSAGVGYGEIGAIKNGLYPQVTLVLQPELLVQQSTLFSQCVEYILTLFTQLLH
ncbi:MAG: hypothetical protein B7Z12_15055, partial [Caulobacter vibrioides]